MIIDQLHNAPLYFSLSERIASALRYLQKTDLLHIEPGRYTIDGDRLFAIVEEYQTKPAEESFWEAHRRYIDLQYVVRGEERIGYANLHQLHPGPYDEAKDFSRLEGKGSILLVQAGTFMILLPEDAHMPGMTVGEPQAVKKVVVKVAVQ